MTILTLIRINSQSVKQPITECNVKLANEEDQFG